MISIRHHEQSPCLIKTEWNVRPCAIGPARELVEAYHYAKGASNTRTYLHGLYRQNSDLLMGVAWWIPPTKTAAAASYPDDWKSVLSLSRLVLHPSVPLNGASFLIGRSIKQIDKKWKCLVTYADEWQGHCGYIYRASGWTFVGKTKAERLYTLNGRMIARKAGPKTRTHQEMLDLGAVLVGAFQKLKFVKYR